LALCCSGEKCEHSLKQITGDVDDEENKEDENLQVESSDPLMGFTFNECEQICVLKIFKIYFG